MKRYYLGENPIVDSITLEIDRIHKYNHLGHIIDARTAIGYRHLYIFLRIVRSAQTVLRIRKTKPKNLRYSNVISPFDFNI